MGTLFLYVYPHGLLGPIQLLKFLHQLHQNLQLVFPSRFRLYFVLFFLLKFFLTKLTSLGHFLHLRIVLFKLSILIFINPSVKADSKKTFIDELQKGGKLIFIRHAYAPGGGDPDNFDINDCTTQRNLSDSGRFQSQKIGNFFKKNKISIGKVYSSEWCRCKETASIA